MTATFHPNLDRPLDRVRQRLGDTDPAAALVQDETITALLSNLTETRAAARLARDLAAKFAREADFTMDGQGQRNSTKSDNYSKLADRLDVEAAGELAPDAGDVIQVGGPIVTGATAMDVLDARYDPDRPSNLPIGWP